MKKILLFAFMIAALSTTYAQNRYLDRVFGDVSVNTEQYATNYTILYAGVTGHSRLQSLEADIYQPVGDTETRRPLILYFHTGNFLPHPQNQSPSGTRRDSTIITMCTRMAQMGYVVASCDYRLGWNPQSPNQQTRVGTLINAAYSGIQDANSAIRYFKIHADRFGIDTNKVVLFGQGTGGYISLNAAALDDPAEIANTSFPEGKFINETTGFPYVIEQINGNIDGTTWGIAVPGHPLAGDTLSKPNNVGPTSDFHLGINLGGALGDLSWLDEDTPPLISFQSPTDPFAPYTSGVLIVPGQNLPVVEVQGAFLIQNAADELDLNASFERLFIDPISQEAYSKNDSLNGLYPFHRPFVENGDTLIYDSSPWDFWAPSNPNHQIGLLTNPNMSKEKAVAYMDTIVGFFAPRACLALDLDCNLSGYLKNKHITTAEAGITAFPNPAIDEVQITSDTRMIRNVVVFDNLGRAVQAYGSINDNRFTLRRNDLKPGLYYARVDFEAQSTLVKIQFSGK